MEDTNNGRPRRFAFLSSIFLSPVTVGFGSTVFLGLNILVHAQGTPGRVGGVIGMLV